MKKNRPVALIILDGFGYTQQTQWNAISQANTPNFDRFFTTYPHTIIKASGSAVGLPEGSIGNSEVGHLTIGSGRIIKQAAMRINDLIANNKLATHPVMIEKLKNVHDHSGTVHIMGLLSDASVHSHEDHLYAFIDAALHNNIKTIYIHAFLDGRDTPPQSAQTYLERLDAKINNLENVHLASIHGRYYAMDRDNNWQRTQKSYDILTQQQETANTCEWQKYLDTQYQKNNNDEFVEPFQCDPNGIVKDGDGIIFYNFRPDRARQLTAAFLDPNFSHFKTKKLNLSCFITPTQYERNGIETNVLLEPEIIKNTLKEILDAHDYRIFTIAETEKYAHVTYFFNGGKETEFNNEQHTLIKSIPTRDYIHKPKMSAEHITQKVLESLSNDPHDFYLINYANADMVGHSGNMDATIKAVECLDEQIGILHKHIVDKMGGTIFLTADHGNAESMFDQKAQQPRTAHTNNPVPFIMMCNECCDAQKKLPVSQLADIAPFILNILEIKVPDEMK